MATERTEPDGVESTENGILADVGSVDTAGIGIVGGFTAHLDVSLPSLTNEDDLADDDVIAEEVDPGGLVIDLDAPVASAAPAPATPAKSASAKSASAKPASAKSASATAPSAKPAPAAPAPVAQADEPEITKPAPEPEPESEPEEAVLDEPAPEVVAEPESEHIEEAIVVEESAAHSARDVERVHTRHDVTLASKRLGELSEASRETPDLLTADRLLDPSQRTRPEPEGLWRQFVYSISGKRINLGDGKRARARKLLDRRIAAPLPGGARFVAVVSRKGGVGKTTVTALLGQALADAREDRIIAIDANPDRGTLAERIARPSGKTVRDLVRAKSTVNGYNDISTIVARDETRLDVLASDSDPRVSEAFSDQDYREVATIAAHYYSVVLTDTGTGIVHSVMEATLDVSDQLVIVAGLSVDEARLASETLTWLETNGYSEAVRNAVVVLNNSRPGTPLVRPEELETHFRTRVRDVVRIPYDPSIATGSAIAFHDLQPATRLAARELAAKVVEGLRTLATAA